jgi:3-oxoacyl-[acyl-carrier protein] reductase
MTEPSQNVILITGSSGGLGYSLARDLCKAGHSVVLNYRHAQSRKRIQDMTDRLERDGKNIMAIQADVRKPDQVQSMIQQILDRWNRLDVLINNVGEFLSKPLNDTSEKEWRAIIDSNLNTVFNGCKAVLPRMRQQQYGRIINVTVATADRIRAFDRIVPYAIAKTGVLILTRSLARAEARHGITVNAISLGLMQPETGEPGHSSRMESTIPAGRPGTPSDFLHAVLYLLHDNSEYVTGTTLTVSGGWGL